LTEKKTDTAYSSSKTDKGKIEETSDKSHFRGMVRSTFGRRGRDETGREGRENAVGAKGRGKRRTSTNVKDEQVGELLYKST